MGIILGFIVLVTLLFVLSKWAARKSGNLKLNRFCGEIHAPLVCIMLGFGIIHMFFGLQLLKTRATLLYVFGIAALLCLVWIVVDYHIKRRQGKEWLTFHRVASVILALCVAGHMIVYFIDFGNYKTDIGNIQIADLDLKTVPDGSYLGQCDAGYIYVKVEVTAQDGKIKNIKLLEHDNERGASAESIVLAMIKQQRLDVDAVSGATNSSRVIKKAVENALTTYCN